MDRYIPTFLNISKLTELFLNSELSFDKMLNLCRMDPFLASRAIVVSDSILKKSVSNSSVHTLSDALYIIGEKNLKFFLFSNLRLTRHISELSDKFPFDKFWSHSIITALISEGISEFLFEEEHIDKDNLYLTALLHDVGKLILFLTSIEDFLNLKNEMLAGRLSFCNVEDEHTSHAVLLKNYFSELSYPSDLATISTEHHIPDSIESSVISLADFSAHAAGFSLFEEEAPPSLDNKILREIHISPERLKVITNDALNKYYAIEENKKLFSILN